MEAYACTWRVRSCAVKIYIYIYVCKKDSFDSTCLFHVEKYRHVNLCFNCIFLCSDSSRLKRLLQFFLCLHGLLKSDMPPLVLTSSWWETSWKRGMGKRWGKFGGDRRSLWRKRRFLLHTYYIICKYKET